MIAIYKKELKSYLTSMVGYLFMAVILLFFGIYFSAVNLQQAYPEIGYALSSTSFIFLIAVPVLTMRVMAEEQKNKTDQMLLTAPVKLEEYRVHQTPPGISGNLVEGRVCYDAFVLENKAKAIYYQETAAE